MLKIGEKLYAFGIVNLLCIMYIVVMGNEIQKIRECLGLSQTAFGDLVGVDKMTVWRWEKNRVTPSKLTMDGLRALVQKVAA